MNRLRPRYWETVNHGARLLALRGARRCFVCYADIRDFRREVLSATTNRRVRSDCCESCLRYETRTDNEYVIRKVLAEAAPAILG